MEHNTIQIIKTSETELGTMVANLSLEKSNKLIILDPQKKLDLVLDEKWAHFECMDMMESTQANSDIRTLNAFLKARCAAGGVETLPITQDGVSTGLKIIQNTFFEENLYGKKSLYLSSTLNSSQSVADLILQTILIAHNEKIKTHGREIRESEKKIVIVFINFTTIMEELFFTIISEARPSNLILIFASTDSNSFNYISSTDIQHYLPHAQ